MVLYGAALKLFVLGALLVRLALPWQTGSALLDALVFVAGMLLLAVLIGVVESVMARLRLRAGPPGADRHHPALGLRDGPGTALVAVLFQPRSGTQCQMHGINNLLLLPGHPAQLLHPRQRPAGRLHPRRGPAGGDPGAAAGDRPRPDRPCPAARPPGPSPSRGSSSPGCCSGPSARCASAARSSR